MCVTFSLTLTISYIIYFYLFYFHEFHLIKNIVNTIDSDIYYFMLSQIGTSNLLSFETNRYRLTIEGHSIW